MKWAKYCLFQSTKIHMYVNKTRKRINQRVCYNMIWSGSPMLCGKHSPRASVTTKTSALGLGFCLLSPLGPCFSHGMGDHDQILQYIGRHRLFTGLWHGFVSHGQVCDLHYIYGCFKALVYNHASFNKITNLNIGKYKLFDSLWSYDFNWFFGWYSARLQ